MSSPQGFFMVTRKLLYTVCMITACLLFSIGVGVGQQLSLHDQQLKIAAFGNRATGSPGYNKAAEYITSHFTRQGLATDVHHYTLPVRITEKATLHIEGTQYSLVPFLYNVITPQQTDGELVGPVIYGGKGSLNDLHGKQVSGSIVMLEFDSGVNWQIVASLGAKAILYLDNDTKGRHFYEEKDELHCKSAGRRATVHGTTY